MSRRKIRGLKTRVRRECSITRGGARLNNGGIQVGEVRGRSHSVTTRDAARGGSSKSESCKSFEFGEGEM